MSDDAVDDLANLIRSLLIELHQVRQMFIDHLYDDHDTTRLTTLDIERDDHPQPSFSAEPDERCRPATRLTSTEGPATGHTSSDQAGGPQSF